MEISLLYVQIASSETLSLLKRSSFSVFAYPFKNALNFFTQINRFRRHHLAKINKKWLQNFVRVSEVVVLMVRKFIEQQAAFLFEWYSRIFLAFATSFNHFSIRKRHTIQNLHVFVAFHKSLVRNWHHFSFSGDRWNCFGVFAVCVLLFKIWMLF